MIPLHYYLIVAVILFSIGIWGALKHTNPIRVLISIELMLNAVNLNLIAFARFSQVDMVLGQVFAIFVIAVAAAEVAIGLAIVLMIVRERNIYDINKINLLKG